MVDKEQVLREYIKFRKLKNNSRGIKDIEFHISKFISCTNKPLKDFDEKVLLNYLSEINSQYTQSTLNTIKSSFLKNFIKWYFEDWSSRFRHLDSLCRTGITGETYKPEEMLSEEEFKKLVQAEDSTFWKAYFMTLFYGGCRPVEVCALTWDKVDFDNDGAFITIYSEKNKRSFIKFVPLDVAHYLKKLKKNSKKFVFLNPRTKKPLTVKGAYWKLRQLSKEVLGKEINLYLLRHSIATIIYNKDGFKDDDIAKQMGHTKSMKGKYVHNNLSRLKAIAKSIYVKPEDLPPERKHALEREIEMLKKKQVASTKIGELNSQALDEVKKLLVQVVGMIPQGKDSKRIQEAKKIMEALKL